jgi:prepilin-type N-terminal cleavage/methylation domain-containing protein
LVAARAGFSLPEALIALAIASVVVLLVGGVFLAQNDFYSHVLVRTQVQENARAMSELVSTEVRSVVPGGIVTADSAHLQLRSPTVTAFVCATIPGMSGDVAAYMPGGVSAIDTAEVAGFGYRDPSTGTWAFYAATWSGIHATGGNPATRCALNGASTSGAASHFVRLEAIDDHTGVPAASLVGSALLIFRRTEFLFDDSELMDGDRALFRKVNGGTGVEFVTGLAEGAHFEYRVGGAWLTSVSSGSVADIDAIRLVAESIGRGDTSDQLTYDFGWTVDIRLPNAP